MAKPATKHLDIKDMSFEKALKELESIVGRLERGDVELEESINIYERGEALQGPLRPAAEAGRGQGREAHLQPGRRAHRHRAFQAAGIEFPLATADAGGVLRSNAIRRTIMPAAEMRYSRALETALDVRERMKVPAMSMDQPPKTPLLDQVHTPADLRAPAREGPAPARRRAAPGDHRRGLRHRRPSGRRARRGRADGGAALGVRHARATA